MTKIRILLPLASLFAFMALSAAVFVTGVDAADGDNTAREVLSIPVAFAQPRLATIEGKNSIEIAECTAKINEYLAPELPYYTASYKLPIASRDLRVELVNPVFKEMQLDTPIKVSQGPIPLSDPTHFCPEPSPAFARTEWFPKEWVRMSVRGGRDLDDWSFKKFVSLAVYPVRCLASDNRARFLSSATVEISYVLDRSRGTLDEPEDSCDLLIIAPDEFTDLLEGLAIHKNLVGTRTRLVALEEAIANPYGNDDAEKLKHFIADHVRDFGTKYVLGVGDSNKFPVRYADVWDDFDDYANITDGHVVPADLYYADLFDENGDFCTWDANGNGLYGESDAYSPNKDDVDLMPDVLFCRIPAESRTELYTAIANLIDYELNVTTTSPGFSDAVLCGSVISGPDPEGEGACEGLSKSAFTGYNSTKLYWTNTYDRNARLDATAVLANINKGCGFATYIGHGVYQAWAFGMGQYLFADQVKDLENETMLPFVSAAACETSGFDNESWEHPQFPCVDSIAEEFIFCPGGGAIAYAGATRVAYGAGNGNTWNFFYAAKLNRLLFEAHKGGKRVVGEMLTMAIENYIESWWLTVYDMKSVMQFCIFGDPSLKIGGPAAPPVTSLHVELSVPRREPMGSSLPISVSCRNDGESQEVLFAVALCTKGGDLKFYPDWGSEFKASSITLESGFEVEDFELTVIDTSDHCIVGYNTFYIMLFEPGTFRALSNLGGSSAYLR